MRILRLIQSEVSFMNVKRLLLLILSLLMLFSCVACAENTEKPVKGPLSKKSDEELISYFVSEYEKALSAPAYFKEYNFNSRCDDQQLANCIGYFMVNGADFLVDWTDFSSEVEYPYSQCIYKDGTLYTEVNGEESFEAMSQDSAQKKLESLGMTYRQIPITDFASQTLTRQMDGSFMLNVTLTDEALQRISKVALGECSDFSGKKTFKNATLTLAFSKGGDLLRSRLITDVEIVAEETVYNYSAEAYLKYTSFDGSKISVSLPEQEPSPENSDTDEGSFSDTFSSETASSETVSDTSETTDTTDAP